MEAAQVRPKGAYLLKMRPHLGMKSIVVMHARILMHTAPRISIQKSTERKNEKSILKYKTSEKICTPAPACDVVQLQTY